MRHLIYALCGLALLLPLGASSQEVTQAELDAIHAQRRDGGFEEGAEAYTALLAREEPGKLAREARQELVRTLYVLGRYDEVAELFAGDRPDAAGYAHLEAGNTAAALALFKETGNPVGQAKAHEASGQLEEAIAVYAGLGPAARGEHVRLLLEKGGPDALQQALEVADEHPDPIWKARVLDRLDRSGEARPVWEGIVRQRTVSIEALEYAMEHQAAPEHHRSLSEMYEQLGDAHEQLDQPMEGARALARAIHHAYWYQGLVSDDGRDRFELAWLDVQGFSERVERLEASLVKLKERLR